MMFCVSSEYEENREEMAFIVQVYEKRELKRVFAKTEKHFDRVREITKLRLNKMKRFCYDETPGKLHV